MRLPLSIRGVTAVKLAPAVLIVLIAATLGGTVWLTAKYRRPVDSGPDEGSGWSGVVNGWFRLSVKLTGEGRFDEAERLLRHLVGLEPDNVSMLRLLVRVLYERGEYAESGQLCRDLLVMAPGDAILLNNLGMNLLAGGDFETGLACLRRAFDLNSHRVLVARNLSAVHFKRQEAELAEFYGKAAVSGTGEIPLRTVDFIVFQEPAATGGNIDTGSSGTK